MTQRPSIEQYIAQYDGDVRQRLQQIYDAMRTTAPDATEAMSYGMPTFKLHGKNLIHFAAATHHIGIYPSPDAIMHFADRLKSYKTSKGTLQLQNDEPLPLDLIREMTQFRVDTINGDTFPMKG